MHLRKIRIEEEIVDISERLHQLEHLEATAPMSRALDREQVAPEPPAPAPLPVERHEGRIYVAGAHGEPHFKSVTWLHRTRPMSA